MRQWLPASAQRRTINGLQRRQKTNNVDRSVFCTLCWLVDCPPFYRLLHSVISNRGVNLSARRLLLLSVVRPTLEYGSEVWEGQAAALESVMLGGAKRILGCSSKTCNEAVRGDMGLETLQGRRDKSKLKVWYKLASMSEDRYPRRVFCQDWNAKPRRGRQRKVWSRLVDNLFGS